MIPAKRDSLNLFFFIHYSTIISSAFIRRTVSSRSQSHSSHLRFETFLSRYRSCSLSKVLCIVLMSSKEGRIHPSNCPEKIFTKNLFQFYCV
mmetsp:Transcript_8323/g.20573  ORF Transcript_8323/g.20573 Transcript_8323/m.20573 type:complete len:92 (+) Transcript_8323:395-670(+)